MKTVDNKIGKKRLTGKKDNNSKDLICQDIVNINRYVILKITQIESAYRADEIVSSVIVGYPLPINVMMDFTHSHPAATKPV